MKPADLMRLPGRLPLILQGERAECGLASLAMVAACHGLRLSLHQLRAEMPLSGDGASVAGLMQAAGRLQLRARALRLEPVELKRLQLPAVLHWNLDHFVVLRRVSRRGITVHDPAVGVRHYRMSEVDCHFSGVAVEFQPSRSFRPADRREVNRLSDLFVTSRGFVVSLLQVFVLSLLLQGFALLTPLYVQLTVDQGLARRDADLVLVIALAFLVLVLARAAFTWLRGLVLIHFGNQLDFQMSTNVFDHLLRLPLQFFERRPLGDIVSRFGTLNNIRGMVSQELIVVVVDGVFSVVTLILLYLYSPLLATLGLLFIVVFLVIRLLLLPLERRRRQQQIAAEASQHSLFLDNVRNIQLTRRHNAEARNLNAWQQEHARLLNAGVLLSRVQLSASTLQLLFFGVDHVLTLYFGTRQVYAGELSIGQLLAFVFLKQHFIASVTAMLPRLVEWRLLRLQLERLADITMTQADIEDVDPPLMPRKLRGKVALQAVSFCYPGKTDPVVQGFTMSVDPGECVALCAPSGGGKSTVLRLVLGLLQPGQGRVLIDDLPLADFGVRSLREQAAAVMHGDALFSGSLLDNITLRAEQADEALAWQCCECSEIAAEIRQLPMRLLTPVGDLGHSLSAGQVQRLLLARALYRRPRLLLLDEALANLDRMQAARIMQRLRQMQMTIIMVSHHSALLEGVRCINLPEANGEGQRLRSPHAPV